MTLAATTGRSDAGPNVTDSVAAWSRYGRYEAGRLAVAFGGRGKASRTRRLAWIGRLAPERKTQASKGAPWFIRGDATLPSGQTVQRLMQGARLDIADAVKAGGNKQRAAELARVELLQRDRQFQAEHSNLSPTTAWYFEEFRRVVGGWAKENKLACGRSAMMELRRRAAEGEPLCNNFKCGCKRDDQLFDAEIFEECVAIDLHPNKFKVTGGYSIFAYGQARASQTGKAWRGNPTTFARRLKEATPDPIRRAGREGLWSAEAYSIPKVHRDRGHYAAGEVMSLDGRLADQFVRVPKSGGGWKLIRPIDICFFDFRSTKLVAWQCTEYESADATLAAYYRLVSTHGVPDRIETDNGKGFVCALVSKRAWSAEEQCWLNTAATLLGSEVYRAPARHAWHKLGESCFAETKEADRQAPFFIGGGPGERPVDVEQRARRNIYDVPTFEEYRAQRERDYELYNSTPRPALNDLTPNLVCEQKLGEIRRVDDDVLQFLCARPGPKRRVGRDGVRFRNLTYGAHDEDVWRLQRRNVWLRVGPDASFVWLCDQGGKPLALATQGRLSGATAEDLKRAERHKARLRKITREYLKGRDFLLGTRVSQVRDVMREYRAAQEAELRKTLPEPPTPAVSIAGAELAEPVKKLKRARRRKEAKRVLQAAAGPAGAEDSSAVSNPFDLLFTSLRDKDVTDDEETGCQADLLKDFGHAG